MIVEVDLLMAYTISLRISSIKCELIEVIENGRENSGSLYNFEFWSEERDFLNVCQSERRDFLFIGDLKILKQLLDNSKIKDIAVRLEGMSIKSSDTTTMKCQISRLDKCLSKHISWLFKIISRIV